MPNDGRALSEKELDAIEAKFFKGSMEDQESIRLFETIRVQRRVLQEFFKMFHAEPLRRVSTADPVRNSTLDHFKELVSMEDPWQQYF